MYLCANYKLQILNLEYFIAKRLITAKSYKSSISSPIIKIAISAIAIGIIMMIVSVATGIGSAPGPVDGGEKFLSFPSGILIFMGTKRIFCRGLLALEKAFSTPANFSSAFTSFNPCLFIISFK